MEDVRQGKVIYLHGDGDGEIDSVDLNVRGQINPGYLGMGSFRIFNVPNVPMFHSFLLFLLKPKHPT